MASDQRKKCNAKLKIGEMVHLKKAENYGRMLSPSKNGIISIPTQISYIETNEMLLLTTNVEGTIFWHLTALDLSQHYPRSAGHKYGYWMDPSDLLVFCVKIVRAAQ